MIPAAAPIAADVDFEFLAQRFVLAGGDIRNIVLDAAYAAAREDGAIGMRHLLRAVAQQFQKRGRVPAAGEFREYEGLLRTSDGGDRPPVPEALTSGIHWLRSL
jgi:hypothetical protein